MNAIQHFADRRPLLFVLPALVVWLLSSALIAIASSVLLDLPLTDNLPQSMGTLGATGALLLNLLGVWVLWTVVSQPAISSEHLEPKPESQ